MTVIEIFDKQAERAGALDWRKAAACSTADPEIFFPVSAVGPSREEIARAKAVCAACQVQRQCLQFAITTRQVDGVWGGTTAEERRLRVRDQRRRR